MPAQEQKTRVRKINKLIGNTHTHTHIHTYSLQVFFARSKSGSSLFPQYGIHLIYSSRCKLLDKATLHTLSTPPKLLFKRISKYNKAWGDVKVMS